MNRTQFGIAATTVVLAVAFVGWKSTRPMKVETVLSRREDVTATLAVSGVLEAKYKTVVSSELGGVQIRKVLVDIGDPVKQGQVVATLDDTDPQTQKSAADAVLAQAEAQIQQQILSAASAGEVLDLANQTLATSTELRQAVSTAETGVKTAKQQVRQAEIALKKVRAASRVELVRQAQESLARAVALRDQRQLEYDRVSRLIKEGALAGSQLDLANTALITASRDVDIAREAVRLAATPRVEDVRQAQSQLVEARLALEGREQTLILAKMTLSDRLGARLQVIQAKGQRNSALASQKVSEAARNLAAAQRASAEAQLAKTLVRAPISGKVAERLVQPGQVVAVGTPMFSIADPRNLRVRLDIDEASLRLLRVGASATVSLDAYPTLQLPAVVTEVGSSANFQRGTVEVRLELKATDPRLKSDLTTDANIVTAQYKGAIVIPRRALLNPDGLTEVYVVKNGVVESRRVKWAPGNTDQVVVTDGLSEGEQVVLSPRMTKPGANVESTKPSGST